MSGLYKAQPPDTFKPVWEHYKEPLQPVRKGFGYKGTLATNKERTHLQCHVCGLWVRSLGIHANRVHNLNSIQYRLKFHLSRSTSLNAEATRNKNVELAIRGNRAKAIRARNFPPPRRKKGEGKRSLEWKNKHGRCPAQLLDKITKLQAELGRTPGKREFMKHYGGYMSSIVNTFGSWNNAIRILNLKTNSPGSKPWYTPEQLITILLDFEKRYNRQPSWSDARSGIIPSTEVYRRTFGSWSEAKMEAFRLRSVWEEL